MIGQEKLLKIKLTNNMLFIGEPLSGRKTLIYELAKRDNLDVIDVENKVSSIRTIESNLYQNTIYLFADLDTWSKESISSMLKMLEENTDNYFCITASSLQTLPDTIQSRCIIYYLEPYTQEQIGNPYCINVGQAKLYSKELLQFIDKLIDNLHVPYANLFKVEDTINEYDLQLFFTVLENRLYERIQSGQLECAKYLDITTRYTNYIHLRSLNKKMFLYNWLIDLKETYNEMYNNR